MKTFARQISPEYQESPLFLGEDFFPDNIAVCGNRDYCEHLPATFEKVREVLTAVVLFKFTGWSRCPEYERAV